MLSRRDVDVRHGDVGETESFKQEKKCVLVGFDVYG